MTLWFNEKHFIHLDINKFTTQQLTAVHSPKHFTTQTVRTSNYSLAVKLSDGHCPQG